MAEGAAGISLEGRRFVIRPLSEADAPEFARFMSSLAREKKTNPGLDIVSPDREMGEGEARELLGRTVRGAENGDAVAIGAFEGGKLAGTCSLWRPRAAELRHTGLFDVAVAEGSRGSGLGEALSRETLARAAKGGVRVVELHVFSTNVPAIRLYEKLGFREAGRIPGFILKRGAYVDDVVMYAAIG